MTMYLNEKVGAQPYCFNEFDKKKVSEAMMPKTTKNACGGGKKKTVKSSQVKKSSGCKK